MNIFSIKRFLPVIIICVCATACNNSEDDQANTTVINTNTAQSPLVVSPGADAAVTASSAIQDIWVLDSINNIMPDSNYFAHGTPYFDLNLDKKTISGHTGCNGLNGKLKIEADKFAVDSMKVAKEVCKDKGFEKKLLKGFKNGIAYNLSNNKLYMKIDAGTVYVFRRIRR